MSGVGLKLEPGISMREGQARDAEMITVYIPAADGFMTSQSTLHVEDASTASGNGKLQVLLFRPPISIALARELEMGGPVCTMQRSD